MLTRHRRRERESMNPRVYRNRSVLERWARQAWFEIPQYSNCSATTERENDGHRELTISEGHTLVSGLVELGRVNSFDERVLG